MYTRWLNKLIGDEHGANIVEWVAMGGLMLTLIAVIYGVMNSDGRLRDAVTLLNAGYAENFGRDVVTQSPGMPNSYGNITMEDGQLIIDDPHSPLQAIVDPLTGEYTIINTATGEQTLVQPGSDMLVTVDTARGLISLADDRHNRTIVLGPLHQHASMIDHMNGTVTALDLADLQRIGAVQVQSSPRPRLDVLAAPMLGLPTLFIQTP